MLISAKLIRITAAKDQCRFFIIYGPLGIGKTAYALAILRQIKAEHDGLLTKNVDGEYEMHCSSEEYSKNLTLDYVKDHLFFEPKEFIRKCLSLQGKDKCVIWDDAGYWLSAMEWNEPFLKAVTKYLNVIRVHFSSVIFTSPSPMNIIKKIRSMPDAYTVKIIERGGQEPYSRWYRQAHIYQWWRSPDMRHSGVNLLGQDDFSCEISPHIYEWYKPYREKYAQMAIELMQKELGTLLA